MVTIQLEELIGNIKVSHTLICRLYGNGEIDVDASFTTNEDFNLPPPDRPRTLIFAVGWHSCSGFEVV
ncbi:hypothetical protein, partial [Bacteroides acidifaciens]|uniref:hypothetical protein n=1 Tax=Bacteroides acidifaciens TaxID=85831 RepID=UPI00214AD65F